MGPKGVIKYYGLGMCSFRSKLMRLSKPVEVTDKSKKHYLSTESVNFPYNTNHNV